MNNPYDLGRNVGQTLAKNLVDESLLTEQKSKKRIIGVWAGRFQPYHAGHHSVYEKLVSLFGKNNVYIGTSGKMEAGRSPLTFSEKRQVISRMFGVPPAHIIQVKSPFAPEEILNKFDPKTTAVVTAFSQKDVGRLSGRKYYKPFKKGASLRGYKDAGYYVVAPIFNLSIGGQNVSGTALRQLFGDPSIDRKTKQSMMRKVYGKADDKILDLLIKKFGKVREGYMISRVLVEMYRKNLLKEGGAAGHMAHPFDDMNLTFGDLKQIISMGFEGQLNVEAPVTEKLDGQNISVSWRDDRGVIFARNKGHLKDRGLNAMTVAGIKQAFAGRGDISNAFSFAAHDLEAAISKLTSKQRGKIFDDGRKFMSIEVLYPRTQNVVPYGHNMLVFHNTIEFDESGNAVGVGTGEGRMLAGMIKQINQNVQKTFSFEGPVVVQLPKSKKFSAGKSKYIGRITRLQNQFKLKDSDTVMMWHQRWWESFITNKATSLKYRMPNKVFMGLVQRWAFNQIGAYSVNEMKHGIKHTKFLNWARDFDKGSKEAQFKTNIAPFEKIFLQAGAEILQNIRGLLTLSPGQAGESMRKELDTAIRELSRATDPSKLAKFQANLAKLSSVGLERLVPTEGIVFMYKGKIYKFTGTFAPLNQIIGLLKFG
jgi:hypothetical protein